MNIVLASREITIVNKSNAENIKQRLDNLINSKQTRDIEIIPKPEQTIQQRLESLFNNSILKPFHLLKGSEPKESESSPKSHIYIDTELPRNGKEIDSAIILDEEIIDGSGTPVQKINDDTKNNEVNDDNESYINYETIVVENLEDDHIYDDNDTDSDPIDSNEFINDDKDMLDDYINDVTNDNNHDVTNDNNHDVTNANNYDVTNDNNHDVINDNNNDVIYDNNNDSYSEEEDIYEGVDYKNYDIDIIQDSISNSKDDFESNMDDSDSLKNTTEDKEVAVSKDKKDEARIPSAYFTKDAKVGKNVTPMPKSSQNFYEQFVSKYESFSKATI